MYQTGSIAAGVVRASLVAGPMFVCSAALANYYSLLPNAVPIDEVPVGVALKWSGLVTISIGLVVIVGFALAILPTAFGTTILVRIGDNVALARLPVVWAGIGVELVAVPALLIASPSIITLALVVTAATCALICRASVAWSAD